MTLYKNSQQVPPMRYGNKPSDEKVYQSWESGEWVAQEKKDGAWYQLEKTDDGEIYLFGRTVSKKTGEYTEKIANVPHIESWAQYLPNGTTLIGEIFVPGGKSNDVTKIMGCTAANAYKRQFETDVYGGPIHYYVFDIIRYKGQSLLEVPFIERYEEYLEYQIGDLFDFEKYVELAPLYKDNFEQRLLEIFELGGEGMVFKHKNMKYRPDKRTSALTEGYKYKEHIDTVDLVCMELLDPVKEYTGKELETWPYWESSKYSPGENQIDLGGIKLYGFIEEYKNNLNCDYYPVTKPWFYGWKNAMRLGAYKNGELVEVCRVASGLTDALREDMANNPDAYLGKVIEISCMSLNKKDYTVRHPVFVCVRFDKDAKDCVLEEIFN